MKKISWAETFGLDPAAEYIGRVGHGESGSSALQLEHPACPGRIPALIDTELLAAHGLGEEGSEFKLTFTDKGAPQFARLERKPVSSDTIQHLLATARRSTTPTL